MLSDARAGSLPGPALRRALTAAYDASLGALLGDPGPGLALVAVGGLGRREPAPGSDLDLVLVHDGRRADVGERADALWYPLWDSGVPVDHSVRTVAEARAVAADDLKAALGLLEARHVAGDADLSLALLSATREVWRRTAGRRLPELREAGEERARTSGEVAFLLEPDLKDGRGGLRDVHALQALAAAQLVDVPGPEVRAAHGLLLDVRDALHLRGTGRRASDRLLLQEQDAVAAALGLPDADALLAAVSTAARTVAFASAATWRRVTPVRRPLLARRRGPVRTPLADDVVRAGNEVVLARDADPAADPVLLLRAARAAASVALPVAPATLARLVAAWPGLPDPWPDAARQELVALLAAGPPALPVLEALDQAGALVRLLPEWERVRNLPQRTAVHRFTVDRHSTEAAVQAAALTRRVSRPDLLLLGALLHDIGKGGTEDHSERGAALVAGIAPRLGLPPADADVLAALVRHHLLLPEVATRRDLDDPATVRAVAAAVGSREVLDLLHALTEADARAAAPAAWTPWRAGLVADLVRRTSAVLDGAPPPVPPPLADWQEELLRAGGPDLVAREDEVAVTAPDRPGLLAASAGVLSLHRLDVRSAAAFSRDGRALTVFRVAPRFGELPDWAPVRRDLLAALAGELPVAERLASRASAYRRTGPPPSPPEVRVLEDASDSASVVEVRAPDEPGVLHRVAAALAAAGCDVRSAHVSSLGADVVDAFYVAPLDPQQRERTVRAVLAALDAGGPP